MAIRYRRLHGLPIGRLERARVAWYGDMDLLPHLGQVFTERAIDVELVWGTPLPVVAGADRSALTRQLEAAVRALLSASVDANASAPSTAPPPSARTAA